MLLFTTVVQYLLRIYYSKYSGIQEKKIARGLDRWIGAQKGITGVATQNFQNFIFL